MSAKQYILGVDAAWTAHQPSGVALLEYSHDEKPRIIRAGRSYEEFYAGTISWHHAPKASLPELNQLTQYCRQLGYPVQVVALDIPLSPKPMHTHRAADRAITRAYGGRGAAVHSPTQHRPGIIATRMYEQLIESGFQWASSAVIQAHPSFIEIYPHAAILELFRYPYRLAYKVHKKNQYWKEATSEERYRRLIQNLNQLHEHIRRVVETGILFELDPDKHYILRFLKGYEDVLDSILAAITGMFYLRGEIQVYGDASSAIWIPAPTATDYLF